jgi:hypothetical protein
MNTVLRARHALPIAVAIAGSSGSGAPASSQTCRAARLRKAATLARPISRARAMSRWVSPWRIRTRTARYWNMIKRWLDYANPEPGSYLPITHWLQ